MAHGRRAHLLWLEERDDRRLARVVETDANDGDLFRLDAEELLEALQERPTPLTDAIFKLIDLVGAALKTLMRADRRFILQCARRTGRQRPRLLR